MIEPAHYFAIRWRSLNDASFTHK